jgi:hypothetical protein
MFSRSKQLSAISRVPAGMAATSYAIDLWETWNLCRLSDLQNCMCFVVMLK